MIGCSVYKLQIKYKIREESGIRFVIYKLNIVYQNFIIYKPNNQWINVIQLQFYKPDEAYKL